MSDSHTPLSFAGLRKREQILATAQRESRRRRQRRLTLRGTLACAVLAGIVMLSMHRADENRNVVRQVAPTTPAIVTPAPIPAPAVASDPAPVLRYRQPEIVIRHVPTDPQLATRLAAPPATGAITRISDDQLLDQLAVAHQPAGLARLKGKTVVMYRNARLAVP